MESRDVESKADEAAGPGLSPGASRRRRARARRERDRALGWWRNRGVIVFLATLAIAAAGWTMVIRAGKRIPVEAATVDGMAIRLGQARWVLDQMDHGENFSKPSVMMPDMPDWGKQRVTLDLGFENVSNRQQIFEAEEFFLVPELGEEVPPVGAQAARAKLAPGQGFNTAIHFDFDTSLPHGKLRVEWRRNGESVFLPVPEPADHYHLRPRGGESSLPPDARLLLPIGKSERGRRLYQGVYGCSACHGDPDLPGSNNVGPHLAGIGTAAAGRIEGMPAPQYIYESILAPGSFIAPECKNGLPCTEPTAMPEYTSLVNLQDAADLLAYLLEQKS